MMKIKITLITTTLIVPSLIPGWVLASGEDDPLLYKVIVDQLEYRDTDGPNPMVWNIDGWLGKDLNKLWIKTEGERINGITEELEVQALYSRAIAPFWDLQAGWRHENLPKPDRDWAVVGVKGLAPYLFEVDAALFVGESGRSAARLEAEYEIMLTQRWVLSPEIELNLLGKSDPERGVGSGLTDIEVGLRLRYEIRREFAPYIGINWSKLTSDTADLARAEGEKTEAGQFVVGVRAWF
ncbi:MAG: copper resistance protein B [Motiliproteus sp.]